MILKERAHAADPHGLFSIQIKQSSEDLLHELRDALAPDCPDMEPRTFIVAVLYAALFQESNIFLYLWIKPGLVRSDGHVEQFGLLPEYIVLFDDFPAVDPAVPAVVVRA